jgi:hypothetical protein
MRTSKLIAKWWNLTTGALAIPFETLGLSSSELREGFDRWTGQIDFLTRHQDQVTTKGPWCAVGFNENKAREFPEFREVWKMLIFPLERLSATRQAFHWELLNPRPA